MVLFFILTHSFCRFDPSYLVISSKESYFSNASFRVNEHSCKLRIKLETVLDDLDFVEMESPKTVYYQVYFPKIYSENKIYFFPQCLLTKLN